MLREMELPQRYLAYANDFERTLKDDDWQRLEQYFTEAAVFEVKNASFACRLEGRDAVLEGLKKSVKGFDLRCDGRKPQITRGPVLNGDQVEMDWTVTYSHGDAPDFVLVGGSVAQYEGDRIRYLYDHYPDAMSDEAISWSRSNTPGFNASYV
jgi:hypothetical protein